MEKSNSPPPPPPPGSDGNEVAPPAPGGDRAEDEDAVGYSFELHEENLNSVLKKIRKGAKVAVVSVVGNFRTGKSFLLTFMLRYLRNRNCAGDSWQTEDGNSLSEGNANNSPGSGEEPPEGMPAHQGFEWRAGHERMTTGIWMYSEPFYHTGANGEEIAVLLVDTQGLFDNETSMTLTSCIFGLSTLMSSYQIYNVKERIGEDQLMNLALFSEYGRMATAQRGAKDAGEVSRSGEEEEEEGGSDSSRLSSKGGGGSAFQTDGSRSFQRLEFLVRDWPDADQICDEFMNQYIHDTIMTQRNHKDLQLSRDQIKGCFDKISCFMLPHPGLHVPRKTFDARVDGLDHDFRRLLNQYMRRVFDVHLEPKKIHGRQLTAPELANYIKSYVSLFQDGRQFPAPATVLQATAEANTRNAVDQAMARYEEEMHKEMLKGFLKVEDLAMHAAAASLAAVELFDQRATMGPQSDIQVARASLEKALSEKTTRCQEQNKQHDPMRGVEKFIVPTVVALVAYFANILISILCGGASICQPAIDLLKFVYFISMVALLYFGWSRILDIYEYLQKVAPALLGPYAEQYVQVMRNSRSGSSANHPHSD